MRHTTRILWISGLAASLAACAKGQDPKLDDTPAKRDGSGGDAGIDSTTSRGAGGQAPQNVIDYDGLNGIVQNPIISHVFTADPSAKVFEDRIYVYASHDLDDQDDYLMTDFHVFSSNDLVNWQDHGVALDAADMPWVSRLYAPDAAHSEVTGKYYLYFANGGSNIGVAVSDSPAGPFEDAIGGPLVTRSTPGVEDVDWIFDPGVFVDDDGQAYLYFGGGMPDTGDNARVIRLAEDMVSLADDEATTIEAPDFFEASYMHKREDTYYFSYSTTFAEHTATIDYMMSDDPMTGFEFGGTILPNPAGNYSGNNHHSVVEYQGAWYVFYHNRVLARQNGYSDFQRSVTLDQLNYDAGGSIVEVPARQSEVHQLRNLDAFSRLEAEAMADQRGIEVEFAEDGGERVGVTVSDIHDEDWIGYSQVDFGDGATTFTAHVAADSARGGTIHVYVDGTDLFRDLPGQRIGSCEVGPTDGWQTWRDVECDIVTTEGVHDLYLSFAGQGDGPLLNLDYFEFE